MDHTEKGKTMDLLTTIVTKHAARLEDELDQIDAGKYDVEPARKSADDLCAGEWIRLDGGTVQVLKTSREHRRVQLSLQTHAGCVYEQLVAPHQMFELAQS